FGENYAQEAAAKIEALAGLPLRWHFIGRIQSNKTALIARRFDWVHTVDRLKIARRLAGHRADGPPLNVLVQVNIDDDPAKGGVAPDEAGDLVDAMRDLAGLRLRGLMAILERAGDAQSSYRRVRTLFESLADRGGSGWDVLSMGMSGDLEAAIAAGATQVRVGTAIFGPR
ncbi:MAG: YggS family pyridoxal phosphate-dependent enzyme, partial [Gammaproteobacteria bacterium]|nr:YggS family pyridoxal phosphate-dependent enzyme [Gammaproteobacteria bacterium]